MIAVARTVGGLEELDDEIKAAGGSGDAGAARSHRHGRHRPARRRHQRALGQARHPGRQCRHARRPLADRPYRGQGLRKGDDDQRHRHLAADPLASIRCCAHSDAGRAIVMSSGAAHSCKAFWGALCGLQGGRARRWADPGRPRRENTPLRVNAVNPGATRTAMRAQAMPGEDPESLPHPSEVAQEAATLCDPELTATGKLYDVRQDRLLSYNPPSLRPADRPRPSLGRRGPLRIDFRLFLRSVALQPCPHAEGQEAR